MGWTPKIRLNRKWSSPRSAQSSSVSEETPSRPRICSRKPSNTDITLDVFYRRAQAYLAAGEPAKAAVEFKTILDHRGWGWWPVYAPLAQLGLARAYAMQGDREKSRKAYDEFFTTWKDADPDIPILRQAKAEYKKLTATAPAAASVSWKK